eukprot:TRINITY_DN6810_c0_g1_i1.p1 TRINITY_DN6810_c0_g1~~TRINITY_DN6810_c0_g1_i1.p1  ORF type:complete len:203 (-),score=17.35 TRINITY_DN6810_c0_g1_i1:235-843(-)
MNAKQQISEEQQQYQFQCLKQDCAENQECADCKAKYPTWASLNFGVFICMNCAGAHRSLGYHITRVKSLNLDSWTQSQITILAETGNKISNDFWERNSQGRLARPNIYSTSYDYEKFIHDKYIKRMFAPRDSIPPSQEFILKGEVSNISNINNISNKKEIQQKREEKQIPQRANNDAIEDLLSFETVPVDSPNQNIDDQYGN